MMVNGDFERWRKPVRPTALLEEGHLAARRAAVCLQPREWSSAPTPAGDTQWRLEPSQKLTTSVHADDDGSILPEALSDQDTQGLGVCEGRRAGAQEFLPWALPGGPLADLRANDGPVRLRRPRTLVARGFLPAGRRGGKSRKDPAGGKKMCVSASAREHLG